MSKLFLVKKPRTTNGRDLVLVDGTVQYKESIVTETGANILRKQNASLPDMLKMIIEPVDQEPAAEKKQTVKTK